MVPNDNNYDEYKDEDEEFKDTMDEFFAKILSIDICYNNGYKLVTSKKTLADLTKDKLVVMFPFNPNKLEDFLNVADLMISYFEQNEEYEKCIDLIKAKEEMTNKISN
jgi:hypothetical protein